MLAFCSTLLLAQQPAQPTQAQAQASKDSWNEFPLQYHSKAAVAIDGKLIMAKIAHSALSHGRGRRGGKGRGGGKRRGRGGKGKGKGRGRGRGMRAVMGKMTAVREAFFLADGDLPAWREAHPELDDCQALQIENRVARTKALSVYLERLKQDLQKLPREAAVHQN